MTPRSRSRHYGRGDVEHALTPVQLLVFVNASPPHKIGQLLSSPEHHWSIVHQTSASRKSRHWSRGGNILFVVGSTDLGSRVLLLFCAAAKPARIEVNRRMTVSMMDGLMRAASLRVCK